MRTTSSTARAPSPAPSPDGASTTRSERAAVEQIARSFHDAWNDHDPRRIAALFAEDADFVNVIGLHWRGREAIEREHVGLHQTRMRTSQLRSTEIAVRFLGSGVALVHDTWELEGDTGIDGVPMPPRSGVLSFVVVRAGDRWQISSAQNTDIVPIPNLPPSV